MWVRDQPKTDSEGRKRGPKDTKETKGQVDRKTQTTKAQLSYLITIGLAYGAYWFE